MIIWRGRPYERPQRLPGGGPGVTPVLTPAEWQEAIRREIAGVAIWGDEGIDPEVVALGLAGEYPEGVWLWDWETGETRRLDPPYDPW